MASQKSPADSYAAWPPPIFDKIPLDPGKQLLYTLACNENILFIRNNV
jgi:hypothetical protein